MNWLRCYLCLSNKYKSYKIVNHGEKTNFKLHFRWGIQTSAMTAMLRLLPLLEVWVHLCLSLVVGLIQVMLLPWVQDEEYQLLRVVRLVSSD